MSEATIRITVGDDGRKEVAIDNLLAIIDAESLKHAHSSKSEMIATLAARYAAQLINLSDEDLQQLSLAVQAAENVGDLKLFIRDQGNGEVMTTKYLYWPEENGVDGVKDNTGVGHYGKFTFVPYY